MKEDKKASFVPRLFYVRLRLLIGLKEIKTGKKRDLWKITKFESENMDKAAIVINKKSCYSNNVVENVSKYGD